MRFKSVKIAILICAAFVLMECGACKKYCYTCNQYCAWCVPPDSSYHLKACENETQGKPDVDSIISAWEHAGLRCNLLNQGPANFCDNKNGAASAVSYYGNEDYFCYPQQ